MFRSVRFKLTLITFVLIALITTSSLFIVMGIMNRVILDQLLKRGIAVGNSVATAAAYSLLSDDRLALDNLSAKLRDLQDDILFVTAVDSERNIVAHSDLGMIGKAYVDHDGVTVKALHEGARVKHVLYEQKMIYEVGIPIMFAGKQLGYIFLGVGTDSLEAAQSTAARNIIIISVLVLFLGAVGVFFLSKFITTPIERLTEGVTKLSSGEYTGEIHVVSRDEIGELTQNFNRMAQLIIDQKGKLKKHATELEVAYIATVKVLATAIDARDSHTLGHSARVARLSRLLGERMGLGYEELHDLEMACLFHDVGKIRTPDHILHKEGCLNHEEYALMMRHTDDGADILRLVDSLHKHIPSVLHHHEWYNGEGYPARLCGDDIPLFAAIMAITDAYDAMTSSRPYKNIRTKEDAIRELKAFRGVQFNPKLTDHFIEIIKTAEVSTPRPYIEI